MDPRLASETVHYQYLRREIQERFPDADEETLQDTLEGLTDLNEMISAVVRSRLDDVTTRFGSGKLKRFSGSSKCFVDESCVFISDSIFG